MILKGFLSIFILVNKELNPFFISDKSKILEKLF